MSNNSDAKPLNDRDSFPKTVPQISPTETKSAYETHEGLAFIHRVERDNAEDFAGELAADLRAMREENERLKYQISILSAGQHDARQILTNLYESIAKRGNYSAESTMVFLDQASACLRTALCEQRPERDHSASQ